MRLPTSFSYDIDLLILANLSLVFISGRLSLVLYASSSLSVSFCFLARLLGSGLILYFAFIVAANAGIYKGSSSPSKKFLYESYGIFFNMRFFFFLVSHMVFRRSLNIASG